MDRGSSLGRRPVRSTGRLPACRRLKAWRGLA